ncbi:ROK family transcriptional regulator [Streptomyces sp. ST2-7A]|uniref:ROK family transcriptional regulator n=1 Tax=Streptomyces sp. ST2-7A TaxID=2907214 RepID=UPI001F44C05D|nr:ROK family transcriptional regulator [Streptomyces sp. ST2-7A]MCE7083088.1 ROK family transcriptional regulator [Streptomyces sp. ST2-7A]
MSGSEEPTGRTGGRPAFHANSRAAVLDVIRAAGTISRVGLVETTGFTGATISTVVRRLIDDGLVVETGHAESTGGKRRVLLALNRSSRYAVGVHLDQGGVTYVLTNLGGAVVARVFRPGGSPDPEIMVGGMAEEIASLIESVGVAGGRVLGVGLAVPGPLARGGGMRLTPPAMRRWEAFPLDRALGAATGLPVVLDNDATASALGEHWSGGVGGTATFAAVYLGTGIGAGLLINGVTYRGVSGNAGEIGHICLRADGPECWCGARGCTEALAGPAAVVEAARADPAVAAAAGLNGTDGRAERPRGGPGTPAAEFAAVARAALRGDAGARALLEDSARYLALAVRTLANVMDLEEIVLTGPGLAVAGSLYLPVVEEELNRAFFARGAHGVAVRLSESAAGAPAIGAAALVLRSELVPLREGLRLPEKLPDAAARPPVTS